MKLLKFLPLATLLLLSCSRVRTINTREHNFNSYPKRLVVLQVPGLSEEHLAYIRYRKPDLDKDIWPEKFSCFGKAWRHNLYELRPSANDGLLSQINGVVSSVKTCAKFERTTIWKKLKKSQYKSFFIQRGNGDFSEQALACNPDFFKDIVVLDSRPIKKDNSNTFHFQREKSYEMGVIYQDKACTEKGCYSTTREVFDHAWENIKNKGLIVLQEFSLKNALDSGNKKDFLNSIVELSSLIEYMIHKVNGNDENTLLLVTSSSPIEVTWPKRGKLWEKVKIRKSMSNELMAPVWANGALSENFCGIYSESDIFNRLFWRSDKMSFPVPGIF